jgi:LacI family transcriptional regulator
MRLIDLATIKDIAKKAGVSISTVSYALNGTGAVSDATKKKILEVAKELNYNPNAIARRLKKKKQELIAVIVRDFHGPIYGEIIRGIRDVAQENDYEMVVAASYNNNKLTKILTEWVVDGAIILDSLISDETILDLANKDFHIVTLDRVIDKEHVSNVLIDNERAARRVVEYFVELGYSEIGFIGGPKESLDNIRRCEGFKEGMNNANLSIENDWFVFSDFTERGGYQSMIEQINNGKLPRAYFVANDEMAIGAMKALQNANIRIPEDVAIIGFDDIQLADYMSPKLTTVRRPSYELGSLAGEILIKSLKKGQTVKNKLLETELIIRESCHKR